MLKEEKKNNNRKVSDDQVREYHLMHKQGNSIVSLSKMAGLNRHNLRKRFIALGLDYSKIYSSSTTMHKFFDKIDSEEKAYLLGFITADGSIMNKLRNRFIALGVQERDRSVIDLLIKCVSPNLKALRVIPKLPNRQAIIKVQISSKMLVEDLILHGLSERKFSKEFTLSGVPTEMIRHVLRGFFDGDGCVYNSGKKVVVNAVCTSKPFLLQIQGWLNEKSIKSTIVLTKSNNRLGTRDVFKIGIWSKKDVQNLKDYFYSGSNYYLERKYLKFFDNTELINRLTTVDSVTTTS